MKRTYLYSIAALLISLWIYLFYRTEKTVVNDLLINFVPIENYRSFKHLIHQYLPLNEFIVFSLPEGLWVFCITLLSKDFYLRCYQKEINCAIIPLVFAVTLEIFQLFHLTNGRFDFYDVSTAIVCWCIAFFFVREKNQRQELFKSFDFRNIVCTLSYAIVFLAHVWE